MKKICLAWLLGIVFSMVIGGCSTNGDDIGDLYGTWKLKRFECPQDTVNFDTVFISFQGEAYQLHVNWNTQNAWGVFEYSGDLLYLRKQQYGGDFSAFRIAGKEARFHVDGLSGKKLTLSRNDSVWYLKKFY